MRKTIVSAQILGRMTYEIPDIYIYMLNGCSQEKNKKFSSGNSKDLFFSSYKMHWSIWTLLRCYVLIYKLNKTNSRKQASRRLKRFEFIFME